MLLLSDLHLGLSRKTGTTPVSMRDYEDWQFNHLEIQLTKANDDILILGDLFDSANVRLDVVWRFYNLVKRLDLRGYIVAGNHDLPKDTTQMSSFQFLAKLLEASHPQLRAITEPHYLAADVQIIPHLPTQERFNKALEASTASILLTHCNYDNFFATEKDHSLNMTKEQAGKFDLVISGHEHTHRKEDNVIMLGSLLPTSVGEAKNPSHTATFMGHVDSVQIQPVYTDGILECTWEQLKFCPERSLFVKVTGETQADQAAEVLQEVSNFRRRSRAFMIQNAVTINSVELAKLEDASLDTFAPLQILASLLPDDCLLRLEELGYAVKKC